MTTTKLTATDNLTNTKYRGFFSSLKLSKVIGCECSMDTVESGI